MPEHVALAEQVEQAAVVDERDRAPPDHTDHILRARSLLEDRRAGGEVLHLRVRREAVEHGGVQLAERSRNPSGRQPIVPVQAEKANLRLATALGADIACFDASRILRPPGTWNHKHQPPQRVRVLDHRLAVRFELDEVIGALPQIELERVERRWTHEPARASRRDPLLALAPALYVSRLLGVHAAAGRKVRCPFHEDMRPSLHVYRTGERGWCCFSCRRGGTIYDLAADLWGVKTRGRDFIRLRERLTDQFALDLARGEARRERGLGR